MRSLRFGLRVRTSVSLFLRLRATHWHFRWLPGSGSGTGLLPDLGALLPAAVLILTDDQDIELNERLDSPLGPMRHSKVLLQAAGALGTHSYVNVPICCPSRSNILTGRYAHNLRDDHFEPFPANGEDADGHTHNPGCGDEPIEKVTFRQPASCATEPSTCKQLPCGCMRMNVSSLGDFPAHTYPVYLRRAGCKIVILSRFACCPSR